MRLGDLEFPIDDYDSLPSRDLVDFRDFLRNGLASPFWSAYREIVEGNARGYERQLLHPAQAPGLDSSFGMTFVQGQLDAARRLIEVMDRLLDDVSMIIPIKQAQEAKEQDDERRRQQPQRTEPEPGPGPIDSRSSP
jgi:hypothetical protein